ncbi:MAG: GTPase-associated system all-helical protein GASH [Pirellulaceae bacterium]
MISKTFDWLRTTEIQPSNDDVESQHAIVSSLLTELDDDNDIGTLLSLVAAACSGISTQVASDQEYGQSLIEVAKQHRPAISSNVTEIALELRITCLITLGEFVTRKSVKEEWWQAKPLASLLYLSGVGLRDSEGAQLDGIREEIAIAASSNVQANAASVRTRKTVKNDPFHELSEPADFPTFWSELKPVLVACLQTIQQAANADRDELEVLWWLYGRFSEIHGKPIAKLSSFEAAIAAASELVDRSLVPAHPTLRTMIVNAALEGRTKASLKEKELAAVVGKWRENDLNLLTPKSGKVRELSVEFPMLMPLTWIAVKCADSGVRTGWEAEFEMKSRLDAKLSVSPELLASQTFVERTAQRLLASHA